MKTGLEKLVDRRLKIFGLMEDTDSLTDGAAFLLDGHLRKLLLDASNPAIG